MSNEIPVLTNQQDALEAVHEGESCNIIGQFAMGSVNITQTQLQTAVWTLYDDETDTIINSRENVDMLSAVGAGGNFTLRLGPTDNVLVGSNPSEGDVEYHVVRIVYTWDDGTEVRTGKHEVKFYVLKMATPQQPS